jgi:hypothetical protein
METNEKEVQQVVDKLYSHAANLLVNENKSNYEVVKELVEMGVDEESANTIVVNLEEQIAKEQKSSAKRDMLYGALWCVGGTVLTLSDTGFIFWGAIVFGGYQFIKGVINYQK